jgi:hypothetical protein
MTLGYLLMSVELGTLSLQLSLHCNSKCGLVILKTPIDVMPGLNISSSNDVRKALFMLSCDRSRSVLHKFYASQRSNRFLNLELVSFGLAHTL